MKKSYNTQRNLEQDKKLMELIKSHPTGLWEEWMDKQEAEEEFHKGRIITKDRYGVSGSELMYKCPNCSNEQKGLFECEKCNGEIAVFYNRTYELPLEEVKMMNKRALIGSFCLGAIIVGLIIYGLSL
jgi:hypothetical protein